MTPNYGFIIITIIIITIVVVVINFSDQISVTFNLVTKPKRSVFI